MRRENKGNLRQGYSDNPEHLLYILYLNSLDGTPGATYHDSQFLGDCTRSARTHHVAAEVHVDGWQGQAPENQAAKANGQDIVLGPYYILGGRCGLCG